MSDPLFFTIIRSPDGSKECKHHAGAQEACAEIVQANNDGKTVERLSYAPHTYQPVPPEGVYHEPAE